MKQQQKDLLQLHKIIWVSIYLMDISQKDEIQSMVNQAEKIETQIEQMQEGV